MTTEVATEAVTLRVDGETVRVPAGSTVLDAVLRGTPDFPPLCKDAEGSPLGACRTCLVQIEGVRGMPASCYTAATAGMEVRTQAAEVVAVRLGGSVEGALVESGVDRALLAGEASELLAASNLKFEGHVEPRGIVAGKVDVVVCDGFTGNILIKAMEATAEYAFAELRTHVKARRLSQLGALLMRPSFRELRRRTDYAQWGGVPLLGVNGVVILGHGRSHAEAVVSGLRVAERAVRAELVPTIAEGLSGLSASA